MVMSAGTVRAVARAVEHQLRNAERTLILPDAAIAVRLPIKAGSRITSRGIAKRLLIAIRRENLTRFMEMELPPTVRAFRASTRRFSVRAYEDYDLYKDETCVWFDVLGARG